MEYTLILVVITILLFVINKLNTLEVRIKSMKSTLDQIADQVEVPEHPVNDELRKLVKEGKEVEAVKEARKALGLSLIEAKQYVDALKTW